MRVNMIKEQLIIKYNQSWEIWMACLLTDVWSSQFGRGCWAFSQ